MAIFWALYVGLCGGLDLLHKCIASNNIFDDHSSDCVCDLRMLDTCKCTCLEIWLISLNFHCMFNVKLLTFSSFA